MKRFLVVAFTIIACLNVQAEEKIKIAVMEFEEGIGVSQAEVDGLSDMLINSLYKTGKFNIVERSQLKKVLAELKFQRGKSFSQQDLATVGELLGVKALVIGRVNFIASNHDKEDPEALVGEYNVDVRAVYCETGELITTAGATKTDKISYRDLMENISSQLKDNLIIPEKKEKPVEAPKIEDVRPTGIREFVVASVSDFGHFSYFAPAIEIGKMKTPKHFSGVGISFADRCSSIKAEDKWYYSADFPSFISVYGTEKRYLHKTRPSLVLEFDYGLGVERFINEYAEKKSVFRVYPFANAGVGYNYKNFTLSADLGYLYKTGVTVGASLSYMFDAQYIYQRFKDEE